MAVQAMLFEGLQAPRDLTYYHGSCAWIPDGGLVIPGAECGNGEAMDDVYLTTDRGLAMQYAAPDGYLYQVEPISDVFEDYVDDDGHPFTFTCDRARVVQCLW